MIEQTNIKEKVNEEYWIKYLQNVVSIQLNGNHRLSAGQVKSVVKSLDEGLIDKLRKVCHHKPFNLYKLFVSSLLILLYRFTGSKEIMISIPSLSIGENEVKPNLQFLKISINEAQTIKKLLNQVHVELITGLNHTEYDLVKFQNRYRSVFNRNDHTIKSLCFTYDKVCSPVKDLIDFDLNISIEDQSEESLGIRIAYDVGKYDHYYLNYLLNTFQQILEHVVDDLDLSIGKVNYITSDLLKSYRRAEINSEYQTNLLNRVGKSFVDKRDHIAIDCEDIQISYGQLQLMVDVLAYQLIEKFNVRKNDLVAISMDRTEFFPIVILGILKAGAGYVPLNRSYPLERKRAILQDCNCKVLVNDEDNQELEFDHILNINSFEWSVSIPNEFHFPAYDPESFAYAIFTSGTTSRPKGILIKKGGIDNLMNWYDKRYDFSTITQIVQITNPTIDIALQEILSSFTNGLRLCIAPEQIIQNTDEMRMFIVKKDIHFIQLIPSTLKVYLGEGERLDNLKVILVGGDRLQDDLKEAILKKGYNLENVYGQTETSIDALYCSCTLENSYFHEKVDNYDIYILNEQLEIQPYELVGEICVGGIGVAAGYLNSPELTHQKFIKNPYDGNNTMYRTGDLGKKHLDGSIEVLGRDDFQVKIQGYRVELKEIEATIAQHQFIEQVVVVALGEEQKELIAFIVTSNLFPSKELRSFCLKHLPDYMVPSQFISLEQIPLTDIGKVDIKRLKSYELTTSNDHYVAPSNPIETQLVQIWQQVLGKSQVGIHDNYFSLGGDSIKAIRIASEATRVLNARLEVKDLFTYQTIEELAAQLNQSGDNGNTAKYEKIAREFETLKNEVLTSGKLKNQNHIEDIYPLSDIQHGIIYHHMMGAGLYHDQDIFGFSDHDFDLDVFKKAFAQLIFKHPSLRTGFKFSEFKKPIQLVYSVEAAKIPIAYMDITNLSKKDQDKYITNCMEDDRQDPFDIEQPCLWRVYIFRLSDVNYTLLWVTHHAIMDGWSAATCIKDLTNIYYSLKDDPFFFVKPLKASYKDFVIDQNLIDYEQARQFWKEELNEFKKPLLPFSKSGDIDFDQEVNYHQFIVEDKLRNDIRNLSKELNCGVREIFLAAFVYLLHLTTNSKKVSIGLTVNGRPSIEDGDEIVGCFLNTVPFVMDLPCEIIANDFISDVAKKSHRIRLFDKLSLFEIIKSADQLANGHNPLFDLIFNYTDYHVLGGIHDQTTAVASDVHFYDKTSFALGMEINNTERAIDISIFYFEENYEQEDVQRMCSYFLKILNQFVDKAESHLNYKSIFTNEEAEIIFPQVHQLNNSSNIDLVQAFDRQISIKADHVAIKSYDHHLTYHGLNEKSLAISRTLATAYQVRPGDRVAFSLEKDQYLICVIMGILKCGAIYVPIDGKNPRDRIEYILVDTQARLYIHDDKVSVINNIEIPSISISGLLDNLDNKQGQNPTPNIGVNTPAYVMYTSGTTGVPKGVIVNHSSVVQRALNIDYVPIEEMRVLLGTSIGFDVAAFEMWGTLLNGGQLHLIRAEDQLEDEILQRKVEEDDLQTMWFSFSWFRQLVSNRIEVFSPLKNVIVGGEKVEPIVTNKFLEAYPEKNLVNGYGPTENTIFSSTKKIEVTKKGSLPIGKSIIGSFDCILDSYHRPVPYGVVGELFVGGDGLAEGYLNDVQKTVDKFIYTPFGRMYKTGDFCYKDKTGDLIFEKRMDDQVKIRGYRIELSEIENVLEEHPEIKRTKIYVNEGEEIKKLQAVIQKSGDLSRESVLIFLSDKLPEYMIPYQMAFVENDFPLTASGKLDHKRLYKSVSFDTIHQKEFSGQLSQTQIRLKRIWEETLNVSPIHISDNFFEVGGHSLNATVLISKIASEFEKKLNISDVFNNPSIYELSNHLDRHQISRKKVVPIEEQDYYSTSQMQRQIWMVSQNEVVSSAYTMPSAFTIEGEIDIEELEKTFKSIILRHESLRTQFVEIHGVAYQQVLTIENVTFSIEHQRCIDANEVKQWIGQEEKRIFDLRNGPLLRVVLYSVNDSHHILFFNMHHIISDGWSLELISKEFLEGYKSRADHTFDIQYKDCIAWMNQAKGSAQKNRFWKQQLAGEIPQLEFKTDHPRDVKRKYVSDFFDFTFNKDLTEKLVRFSEEANVTLFVTLMTTLNLVLHQNTKQYDHIIGIPVVGRDHPEFAKLVGLFLNTVPVRMNFGPHMLIGDFIKKMSSIVMDCFENHDFPIEDIIKELNIETADGRNPLFDIGFNFYRLDNFSFDQSAEDFKHFKISKFDYDFNEVKTDFWLSGGLEGDQIVMRIDYRKDLYEKDSVETLANNWTIVAELILSHKESKVEELIAEFDKAQIERAQNEMNKMNTNSLKKLLDKSLK